MGWAAKWKTISGRAPATAAASRSASRTSAMTECTSRSTRQRSYRLGSGGGARASPVPLAPRVCSHIDNHAPLNPVWPVTKTRFPAQKFLSAIGTLLVPHDPGAVPAFPLAIEGFHLFERIHRLPEPPVFINRQLSIGREATQGGLLHRSLLLDVAEKLLPEHEEPAVTDSIRTGF